MYPGNRLLQIDNEDERQCSKEQQTEGNRAERRKGIDIDSQQTASFNRVRYRVIKMQQKPPASDILVWEFTCCCIFTINFTQASQTATQPGQFQFD